MTNRETPSRRNLVKPMAESGTARSPRQPESGHAAAVLARVDRLLLIVVLLALGTYLSAIAWELNSGRTEGAALHIDFVAFWAAAKLALAGKGASAFDPQTLVAAQSLASDASWDTYSWHYPPSFHLLIAPLGLLGFSAAFAVFSACAIGAYIWALRGFAATIPGGLGLAVAAPPVLFVLITGNASLLWAAAFLFSLSFLVQGRPKSAGAMIALMTLKPQLGLMIPIALVAGRQWRPLLWSVICTAAITALTVAVFGPEYWARFFEAMAATGEQFRVYGQNAVTMITWYAFSRQVGAGHDTATAVQVLSLAVSAGAVGVLWSRRAVAMDLKIAGLCLAILTSTPYAYQYELVLAVLAALFLARAGVGDSLLGRVWLFVLWALPVPGWLIGGLEIAQYAAPVLSASLLLCAIGALRAAVEGAVR
jgi:hypothetical protein